MSDTIVIRGFTASNPTLAALPNGVPVVNFRLASTPRWQDATGTWKEGTTNWYTIKAYRRLAQNIAVSVQKGQPLVISGRQRINRWNREDGTQGTTVEIDAQGIGHDLNYGTSSFARTVEKRALHEDAPLGALPNTPQGAPGRYRMCPRTPSCRARWLRALECRLREHRTEERRAAHPRVGELRVTNPPSKSAPRMLA